MIAVRQLAWIALRLAQSIPEFRWVDCVARRILQLGVDVLIVRSGIAHRANRLAWANQITPPHLLGLSMQDFVRKSIGIPYGYSANTAFPGVCHDAGHRRPQFRIASIKPRVLAADIIEIDASMRNARGGLSALFLFRSRSISARIGDMGHHAPDRRQHAPHNVFPRHIQFPFVRRAEGTSLLPAATSMLKTIAPCGAQPVWRVERWLNYPRPRVAQPSAVRLSCAVDCNRPLAKFSG